MFVTTFNLIKSRWPNSQYIFIIFYKYSDYSHNHIKHIVLNILNLYISLAINFIFIKYYRKIITKHFKIYYRLYSTNIQVYIIFTNFKEYIHN